MNTALKRQLIILPVLMGGMALLHAWGAAAKTAHSGTASAQFNTTYTLTQGSAIAIAPAARTGTAASSAPRIKLERVNDSRCRTGVVCVWAGYISYSFTLTSAGGRASSFVLSDSMPNGKPSVTRNGLTFTLAGVEPQAVPAKDEARPDYRVSLRVSNTPSP